MIVAAKRVSLASSSPKTPFCGIFFASLRLCVRSVLKARATMVRVGHSRERFDPGAFVRRVEVVSMLKENEVATAIVDVAYHIHRQLGPGLLESVYHAVMRYELQKRGLRVLSKEPVPIVWEDVRLDLAFEADLIVEDVVVVELKSVEQPARVHNQKQLLTYLRLTDCRLGLLINFGRGVHQRRSLPCRERTSVGYLRAPDSSAAKETEGSHAKPPRPKKRRKKRGYCPSSRSLKRVN